jgi:hypothetical protein
VLNLLWRRRGVQAIFYHNVSDEKMACTRMSDVFFNATSDGVQAVFYHKLFIPDHSQH